MKEDVEGPEEKPEEGSKEEYKEDSRDSTKEHERKDTNDEHKEEQEQMDEAGMEGGIGLTHQWTSVEMTNASTCESVLDTANDHDQDHEYDCDGRDLNESGRDGVNQKLD